jgi:hypothetical protein
MTATSLTPSPVSSPDTKLYAQVKVKKSQVKKSRQAALREGI